MTQTKTTARPAARKTVKNPVHAFASSLTLGRLTRRFIPKRWLVVEPGLLFRSGQLSPSLVERTLRKNKIRIVVDLQPVVEQSEEQESEARAMKKLGIEPHRFTMIGDGTGKIETWAGAVAVVAKAHREKRPCLVHCSAGTERTGSVILAFRVLFQHWPFEKAFAEMCRAGHNPVRNPNLHDFLKRQLPELEKFLVSPR